MPKGCVPQETQVVNQKQYDAFCCHRTGRLPFPVHLPRESQEYGSSDTTSLRQGYPPLLRVHTKDIPSLLSQYDNLYTTFSSSFHCIFKQHLCSIATLVGQVIPFLLSLSFLSAPDPSIYIISYESYVLKFAKNVLLVVL